MPTCCFPCTCCAHTGGLPGSFAPYQSSAAFFRFWLHSLLPCPAACQALRDWFVGVPNGVGAAFNIVCVVFCFAFPAKGRSRLHGEVNPAANWGALRLQSARHPDTGAPGFESPATAGGFFDVSQFRWRGGAVGSFLRLPSGGSFGGGRRSSTAAATAGADAGMPAVLPVAAAQGSMASFAEDAAEDCRLQGVDLVVVGGEEGVGSGAAAAAAAIKAVAGFPQLPVSQQVRDQGDREGL